MKTASSQAAAAVRFTPYGRALVLRSQTGTIEFDGIAYTLAPGADVTKISHCLLDGAGRALAGKLNSDYGAIRQLPSSAKFDEVFARCATYDSDDRLRCDALIELAADLPAQTVHEAASVYATALAIESVAEATRALGELCRHTSPEMRPCAVLGALPLLSDAEAQCALQTLRAAPHYFLGRNYPNALLARVPRLAAEDAALAVWSPCAQLLLTALVHDDGAQASVALDALVTHTAPAHLYRVMLDGFLPLPTQHKRLVLTRFRAPLYAAALTRGTYDETVAVLEILEKTIPSGVTHSVLEGFELLAVEDKVQVQNAMGCGLLALVLSTSEPGLIRRAADVLLRGVSPAMQDSFMRAALELLHRAREQCDDAQDAPEASDDRRGAAGQGAPDQGAVGTDAILETWRG